LAVDCTIAQAAVGIVLADENLTNQVAGKRVVKTGTTATIQAVSPAICDQIVALARAAKAAQAAKVTK
jgi:hypothetical protein